MSRDLLGAAGEAALRARPDDDRRTGRHQADQDPKCVPVLVALAVTALLPVAGLLGAFFGPTGGLSVGQTTSVVQ